MIEHNFMEADAETNGISSFQKKGREKIEV